KDINYLFYPNQEKIRITFYLYIKPEVHDIPILDDIALPLDAEFPSFFHRSLRTILDEVVVFDDFRPNESLLEIGVDDTVGLGCGNPIFDGPSAYSLHTGSEVGG